MVVHRKEDGVLQLKYAKHFQCIYNILYVVVHTKEDGVLQLKTANIFSVYGVLYVVVVVHVVVGMVVVEADANTFPPPVLLTPTPEQC